MQEIRVTDYFAKRDSSFTFWTDEDGTFYRSDNPYSEKVECGTIEDVNEFLEIFA